LSLSEGEGRGTARVYLVGELCVTGEEERQRERVLWLGVHGFVLGGIRPTQKY